MLEVALSWLAGSPVASVDCSPDSIRLGTCSLDASVHDQQVDLVGQAFDPGQASGQPGAGSGDGIVIGRYKGKVDPDACEIPVADRCRGYVAKSGLPAAGGAAASIPPVTIRDLAAFRPTPGSQSMEPNGWVVPGLDANIFAIVDQQLVPGTLFGRPATVRFTPIAYRWSYGDGTSAIRNTPGGTWATLGLRDFDPTPTSHVYAEQGEYVIRLTIDFRAEYRFGSSAFVPVAGSLNLPANELRVTVTGAKTVLVDQDCAENPSGPGC